MYAKSYWFGLYYIENPLDQKISPQRRNGVETEDDELRRQFHDDVIKWKHFPRYWPFVRGIHRSPVNSPHKGQWRGALMFSLICARINGWINNGEAGDLRRHCAHYDVIVMSTCTESQHAMLPSVSHLAADDSHRNCRFSRLLEHTPDVDHRKWVITVSGKISSSDVNLSNTVKSHLCIESLSWYVLNYECQKYIHINLDHKDTKCLSWK